MTFIEASWLGITFSAAIFVIAFVGHFVYLMGVEAGLAARDED